MSSPVASHPSGKLPLAFIDRLARNAVTNKLSNLLGGEIVLHTDVDSTSLGRQSDLKAVLRVNRPKFFRDAILGGTLSVAESYIQRDWDCEDLTSLFRIFIRNRTAANRLDGGWTKIAGVGNRLFHWWHANTRSGSRRNIGAHYDLGNEFFRLWLDETLAYSCGIFSSPRASMQEASIEKFDRVCRKLDLRPSDAILEIGSGWGGFAMHAAQNYGCHVTTTTISREQFEVAQHRIKDAGLADKIKLLQRDYRDLQGKFDKLVSIEMIEAVGYRYLDQFFSRCGKLLKPDGSFVLQAITMPDRGYKQYLKSVDFIQRYIFPGGCLPSLGAIQASVGRTTELRFFHAEEFAPHYAETLRRWRQAFHQQIEGVRRLGYTEQFIRLWDYYLCYCEAAFEERHIGVLQIQLDMPEVRRELEATATIARAESGLVEMNGTLAGKSHEMLMC